MEVLVNSIHPLSQWWTEDAKATYVLMGFAFVGGVWFRGWYDERQRRK